MLAADAQPNASIDLAAIRSQFPSLAITDDGRPRIYLDNPAGTQVPNMVIERVSACLLEANANLGGHFTTSQRATAIVDEARQAMADFLNADSPEDIIFGQNMTTITLHVARSLGRLFQPGDEIIVTQMDHDANVEPWRLMARDHGLEIRWLPFNTDTYEFDIDTLDALLNERTRLVCFGGASNLTGTINDVKAICAKVRDAGAWSFVDAVQSAPHVPTNVEDLGCDFLVCSAYKFFGPHVGIMWARRAVIDQLEPYRVRPAPADVPGSFETGTLNHEGIAGVAAAVDYFAWVGGLAQRDGTAVTDRRTLITGALDYLLEHEQQLSAHLIEGLQSIPGTIVRGITDPGSLSRRVSTVSFTHAVHAPASVSAALAERGIFVWDGHNYALEVVRAMGLLESGGTVRIGAVHYNTLEEINTVLNALDDILS